MLFPPPPQKKTSFTCSMLLYRCLVRIENENVCKWIRHAGKRNFKSQQLFLLESFIVERMRSGIDILVGTPGRIKDHLQNGKLDLTKLKHVVLDEVDQMLDMGFADQVE